MKSRQQPIVLQDTRGNFYLAFRIKVPKHKSRQYKKHLSYVKKWRKRNKQKLKEYGRQYYQEHKEQYREYYRRPEVLARQRKYRRKNRDIISKKNRIRYLRRKNKH
jgi:hypothetical protein